MAGGFAAEPIQVLDHQHAAIRDLAGLRCCNEGPECAEAAEASDVIRESFRQFLGDSGLGPVAAIARITSSIGPLSTSDRTVAEEALLGLTQLSPAHQQLIAALLAALKDEEQQAA